MYSVLFLHYSPQTLPLLSVQTLTRSTIRPIPKQPPEISQPVLAIASNEMACTSPSALGKTELLSGVLRLLVSSAVCKVGALEEVPSSQQKVITNAMVQIITTSKIILVIFSSFFLSFPYQQILGKHMCFHLAQEVGASRCPCDCCNRSRSICTVAAI